jgi:hypothetical protein
MEGDKSARRAVHFGGEAVQQVCGGVEPFYPVTGCHTLVLGNRTKASIRAPRMFKSHVRPTIW